MARANSAGNLPPEGARNLNYEFTAHISVWVCVCTLITHTHTIRRECNIRAHECVFVIKLEIKWYGMQKVVLRKWAEEYPGEANVHYETTPSFFYHLIWLCIHGLQVQWNFNTVDWTCRIFLDFFFATCSKGSLRKVHVFSHILGRT